MSAAAGLIGIVLAAGIAAAQAPRPATTAPDGPGKELFARWCSGCHGDGGAGDGFAAPYMIPRPRDLTLGNFYIRSTGTGDVPTDADLRRTISEGFPGTAMSGWKGALSPAQIDTLVQYVKTFSPFFAGPPPTVLAAGPEPAPSAEGLIEGRRVYQQLKCFECHGQKGRGDGTSVPTLTDDQKMPIFSADLTRNWTFRGGPAVTDIYRAFRTGLNGTPMPAYTAEANGVNDEQLWRLAQYVRSLSPPTPPDTGSVIHAVMKTDGLLPVAPDDRAWDGAPAHYVPLGGQVAVKPRWFTPSIDGLWVQAMHDGKKLAIKVTWHDPSRSPDPAFAPWLKKVLETLERADPPPVTAQGPDRVVVTFPVQIGADSTSPHFLGGNSVRPAYVWRWSSSPDSVEEGTTRGLARFTPLATRNPLGRAARYQDGEWQLQLSRPLLPVDSATAPRFTGERPVPIAFFVADGSNGEVGTRGSMSGWYTIMIHKTESPQ
jgi:mono/diheme cytochrome c family protein